MEIIYLLIPLSVILVGLIIWIFLWAIRSGQFDDLEGPAHRILMDDDGPVLEPRDGDDGERGTREPGDAQGQRQEPPGGDADASRLSRSDRSA